MHNGKDMEQQSQKSIGIQIGDKIRIRSGPYSGARGVIQAEINSGLEVLLNEGISVHIQQDDLQTIVLLLAAHGSLCLNGLVDLSYQVLVRRWLV